jgi:hypothetical protein
MKTVYVNPWGGVIPGKYSLSAIAFMQEFERLEYLIFYVLASGRIFSTRYDEFRDDSLAYISSLGPTFKETFDHLIVNEADILILSSKSYENILGEMAYGRCIESFLLYLKSVLAEIIQVRPQLLKSGEKETLEFVLGFEDIKELRTALAEKKIESLFYGGFTEIFKFYQSRVGVELVDSEETLSRLNRMTKIRNLIAHNGGKINAQFKGDYPDIPFEVGESMRFTYKDILDDNSFVLKSVENIDSKVSKKFSLSLIPVEEAK